MPVFPLVGSTITVLPWREQAVALGRLDHGEADAVLDAVGGVLALELGEHLGALRQSRGHAVQPHERGASDQGGDVACDPHGVSCRGVGPELEGYPGWRAPVTRAAPRRARWRSSPPAARTRGPERPRRPPRREVPRAARGTGAARPGRARRGAGGSAPRSIPKAAQAARSRSPGAPRAAVMRVPKTGPVALISKRSARGCSAARSSTRKQPARGAQHGHVAELDRGEGQRAPRQRLVEDGGLERGEQEARGATVAGPGPGLAGEERPGALRRSRRRPRSAGAEAVRQPDAEQRCRALAARAPRPRGRRRAPPGGSDSRAAVRCGACGRGAGRPARAGPAPRGGARPRARGPAPRATGARRRRGPCGRRSRRPAAPPPPPARAREPPPPS